MAEQGYRKAAQRSIRKRVETCSCPAIEDTAVHDSISTQDLPHRAVILTEPFDSSVAHAICKLCHFCQDSYSLVARWQGTGRVLSPSNAQRQYEKVKRALGFLLFPIIPVQLPCRDSMVLSSRLAVEPLW